MASAPKRPTARSNGVAGAVARILSDPATLSDDQVAEAVAAGLKARQPSPALVDSLVVRLANLARISMHGRYLRDTLDPPAPVKGVEDDRSGRREHYTISPYNLPSANAVVTAVWRSPETDEAFVLVGRRWAEWRRPTSGLGKTCVLPGGFMDPAPRDGAPDGVRFDHNLDHTAARELKEETGLEAPPPGPRFRQVGTRSDYYDIGEGARSHLVFADYLADFSGAMRPPRAVGDDDLAAVRWIPLSEFTRIDGPAPAPGQWTESRYRLRIDGDDCVLYDPHGQALETTLRAWRDDGLRRDTGLDLAGIEALARRAEAATGRPAHSLLPERPASELGEAAELFHRRARGLGQRLVASLERGLHQPAAPSATAALQTPVPDPAQAPVPAPDPAAAVQLSLVPRPGSGGAAPRLR